MPVLSDYEELDLTGMDIDRVAWGGQVLRATFGDGYESKALSGSAAGLHRFVLSSSCLPDDDDISPIDGVSRFEYYYEFFKRYVTGETDVFVIEWRSRKWHVSFAEDETDFERMTDDLFAGGVNLKQRRVRDVSYNEDGSIFDIADIAGVWAWYRGDEYFDNEGVIIWGDQSGALHNISAEANVTQVPDVVNGLGVMRLVDAGFEDTAFSQSLDPTIYHAFFLMKVNAATFPNNGGLLSADETVAALVGESGTTKFTDLSLSDYTYKLNGVTYAANNQQAPMNEFGVVHAKFGAGAGLANLQIGQDRDFTNRIIGADLCEVVLCDVNISDANAAKIVADLMRRGAVS